MKRILIFVGVVLAIFFLLAGSASGVTWNTYREDITITSGYADISENRSLGYYAPSTVGPSGEITYNASENITLPTNLDNFTTITFTIYNNNSNILVYNLTINGWHVNESAPGITDDNYRGTEINPLETDEYTIAELFANDTYMRWRSYINWSFNASTLDNQVADSCRLNLTIESTDVTLNSSWLVGFGIRNNISINESDVTIPTVGMSQASSFWTVNDSVNVSCGFYWVNMSNLTLNVTYVSPNTIGTPTTTALNFSVETAWNSNINASKEMYTQYQKRGPFVYDVDEEIDGNEHEVTIKLSCHELLTNIVDWTIDPDDEKYDGVFDTLDFDTLVVELAGTEKDWDQDGDNIELEEFTVFSAIINNKWVFTWTVAVAPVPVRAEIWDWFTDEIIAGMPNWTLTLAVIAVISIISIAWFYRKK